MPSILTSNIYSNRKYLEASLTLESLHTEHKALRMQTPSANTLHLPKVSTEKTLTTASSEAWGSHHSMPSSYPSQCQPLQSCKAAGGSWTQRRAANDQRCFLLNPAGTSSTTNKVGSDLEFHEEEFIGLGSCKMKAPQFTVFSYLGVQCSYLFDEKTKTKKPEVHDILH